MPAPINNLAQMAKGMHPAVKVGALIATVALAWYVVKIYQSSKEMAVDSEVE